MINPSEEKLLLQKIVAGDAVALGGLLEEKPEYLRYSNHRRETLLHVAAGLGQVEVAATLIRRGMSPSVTRFFDKGRCVTPLHNAAEGGWVELASLLLHYGVDVDAGIGVHATPLIAASRKGHVAMVELLLDRGADALATYSIDTSAGSISINALTAAADGGHEAVVCVLRQHIKRRLGDAGDAKIELLLSARPKPNQVGWRGVVPAFDARVDLPDSSGAES